MGNATQCYTTLNGTKLQKSVSTRSRLAIILEQKDELANEKTRAEREKCLQNAEFNANPIQREP